MATLPALRQDLQIFPAPAGEDGSPEYTLFDPLTGRYKRLGWVEATLLHYWRPGITVEALHHAVRTATTLRPTLGDVECFVQLAQQMDLTRVTSAVHPERLEAIRQIRSERWWQWILNNYLFIRVPLIRPQRFLENTLPLVRWLSSTAAMWVYALCAFFGFFLLLQQWDQYTHTFVQFLTLQGILAYILAMTGIKLVHEFSHAYVATASGVRVRSMGIAFILFWPVPYSDVTDAWRLPEWKGRFRIGFAGVAAETALAGVCLLAWGIAPAGTIKSLCFLASSATLLASWLVNLNPAMRFDGYYLLSDYWGVENLQGRAFALSRWWLRRFFLGVAIEPPETLPSLKRRIWLLLYSLCTWVYRVGLYFGIALLVYAKFTKVLGMILFAVEIYTFFAAPLVREAKEIVAVRKQIRWWPNGLLTSLMVLAGLFWFVWPLERSLSLPAMAVPGQSQHLIAPVTGYLQSRPLQVGQPVTAAERLVAIRPASLTDRLLGETSLESGMEGVVAAWTDELRKGTLVYAGEPLGQVADLAGMEVVAYATPAEVQNLETHDEVYFYSASGRRFSGSIFAIGAAPTAVLPHPGLAHFAGGPLPVQQGQELRLLDNRIEVRVQFPQEARPHFAWQSGTVVARAKPASYAWETARYLLRAVLREFNF